MPNLTITITQVIELFSQLPQAAKHEVLAALQRDLSNSTDLSNATIDEETVTWQQADLAEELPDYEWVEGTEPPTHPVRYIPGVGLVVEGGKS